MAVQMRESQHPYNNNTNFEVRQAWIAVQDLRLKSPRGWSRSLSKFPVGICGTSVLEVPVKSVQSCLERLMSDNSGLALQRNVFNQALQCNSNSIL